MKRVAAAWFLALIALLTPAWAQEAPSPASALREVVFVSDLHLGLGSKDGVWDAMEDFRWHTEFDSFLRYLDNDLRRPIDLVVLGDFLELWQSDRNDCLGEDNRNYACSSAEAMERIKRVTAAHAALFESLSRFIRSGENTLTIVPGNHDVALLLPGGTELLREAFASDVRHQVKVLAEAYWLSPDRTVLAEHGQQIGGDPNRFENWPTAPWLEGKDGTIYLAQSWGEAFVQSIFNDLERDYPIVDNFSGRLEALKYIKAAEGAKRMSARIGDLFRFLLFQQSWMQLKGSLDVNGMPVWDLDATRPKINATPETRWASLLRAMPDTDIADLSAETPTEVNGFTDDEVLAICNAIYVADACANSHQPGCFCERKGNTLSAARETAGRLVNRKLEGKIFQAYFDKDAGARASQWTRAFYVYGHTHDPRSGFHPYEKSPWILNDGAWQRIVSAEGLRSLMKKKGWTSATVLKQAQPDDLPACYPFVRLTTRKDEARSQRDLALLFWNHRADGATCVSQNQCLTSFLDDPASVCPRVHRQP